MEPHHRRCYMPVAPLLWRPVSSPCMHAGVLVGPGRERWGIGCRRRRELPDPRSGRGPHPRDGRRARMPGRLDPSSAAVDLEVDEAAGKAAVPRAPDLGGERVRPPDSAPYLDPSFQNTAPPSQPAQHNEDTRFPLLFWTLYSPWTLLLYYFCWIKASPRPDATPTVSVVCSSRHTGGECGQAEPRPAQLGNTDDVIPSRSQKFVKTRTGTEERRRRPPSHLRGKWRFFYCHLPCGWLRLSTKTRFSLSRFRRGARGRVARRGIPAPPTPTAGAWLRKGSTPAWAAAGWRGCRLGGGMWRVSCLPPNYQALPVP